MVVDIFEKTIVDKWSDKLCDCQMTWEGITRSGNKQTPWKRTGKVSKTGKNQFSVEWKDIPIPGFIGKPSKGVMKRATEDFLELFLLDDITHVSFDKKPKQV